MRGVFVSSLKLSAFHAGFTWLTLRAFDAHFVCLATAASAVVAVLPLVPVALVAAPAALELALLRGAPVKGLVLAAMHLGAYYFGDDLIFREVRADSRPNAAESFVWLLLSACSTCSKRLCRRRA
jgi:hypothetical protein